MSCSEFCLPPILFIFSRPKDRHKWPNVQLISLHRLITQCLTRNSELNKTRNSGGNKVGRRFSCPCPRNLLCRKYKSMTKNASCTGFLQDFSDLRTMLLRPRPAWPRPASSGLMEPRPGTLVTKVLITPLLITTLTTTGQHSTPHTPQHLTQLILLIFASHGSLTKMSNFFRCFIMEWNQLIYCFKFAQ